MRRFKQGFIVLCVAMTTAAPASADPIEIGHIPECTEAVPAAIAPPSTARETLNVRVLLDGVDQGAAQAYSALAASSYDGIGIDFVTSYQSVSFSGDDAQGLIDQSKALFGGARPAGIDIVYTLTNKDIQAGGNTAVAGLADCIGGVAFPDRAFGVGERMDPDGFAGLNGHFTAKVFAHEVGHLMGAHHHYANCVEGIPSEPTTEPGSACTLMINAVDLSSLNFSALNGLVVRGHTEAYTG